ALFINEMLSRSLKQHTADDVLFEFLFHAIEILDSLNTGLSNYHLYFLLRLSRFLGFYPDTSQSGLPYFDLKDGHYTAEQPPHRLILEPPFTKIWTAVLSSNFNNLQDLKISAQERKLLLGKIIEYYQLHIEGFGQIRSHEILEEVLG